MGGVSCGNITPFTIGPTYALCFPKFFFFFIKPFQSLTANLSGARKLCLSHASKIYTYLRRKHRTYYI